MKTEVLRIDGSETDAEKIIAAARVIEEGGLVAFPTETVYGIGCRAERGAIDRLDELKGRDAGKRYTLHIADKEDVFRYVPSAAPHVRKLISRAWPGPVTIVFELSPAELKKQKAVIASEAFDVLYSGGTVGVRCVADDVGQRLLRACNVPVVAPSANRSGEDPATSAGEVLEVFGGKISMVLESPCGESKIGTSSTVVKAGQRGVEILRAGAVGQDEIREMCEIRILFVCTGNTCRSPVAEGLCRRIISEKLNCGIDEIGNIGYKIGSAGVMAGAGASVSPESVEVCRRRGVDISGHMSRPAEGAEVEKCDFVFVMSNKHLRYLKEAFPASGDRCALLDADGDIADPIGGSVEVYEECARQIENALIRRIGEMWHEDSDSK